MENALRDVRYAFRMLFKSPGFMLVAALALGLGIGANTAIFSVFNGMLWRPLPVKNPQELVSVSEKTRDFAFPFPLSYADIQDYSQLKNVFNGVIGYSPTPVNFGAQGRPERAWAEVVTGNYFSVLGIQATRGRTFASDEGSVAGKDMVVVLSYKYWQKRFGGAANIVGQTVQVNNHALTIIGIASEEYRGAYYFLEPDFYLPLSALPTIDPTNTDVLTNRHSAFLRVLGRLQPGVTPEQAIAAAQPIDRRLEQDFPDTHKGYSLLVIPELKARPEPGLGGFMSTAVVVFMLLVGLVLLIACANVANLILARANGRRKEFATRTALGASRWRMVRQLLTETVLLSIFGGLVGLLFARWAARMLTSIQIPSDIPLRPPHGLAHLWLCLLHCAGDGHCCRPGSVSSGGAHRPCRCVEGRRALWGRLCGPSSLSKCVGCGASCGFTSAFGVRRIFHSQLAEFRPCGHGLPREPYADDERRSRPAGLFRRTRAAVLSADYGARSLPSRSSRRRCGLLHPHGLRQFAGQYFSGRAGR